MEKEKIEELKKYITTRECDDTYKSLFVDFNNDSFQLEKISIDCKLEQTDKSKIKNLILEKIIELSNKNQYNENFSIKIALEGITEDSMISRKVCAKILNGCNIIATDGRIGPANTILISEENYNKYNLSKFDFENSKNDPDKMTREVIFEDSIKDIILYRKNTYEQPGLILLYSEDKYDIIGIGLNPEKQFLKLEL